MNRTLRASEGGRGTVPTYHDDRCPSQLGGQAVCWPAGRGTGSCCTPPRMTNRSADCQVGAGRVTAGRAFGDARGHRAALPRCQLGDTLSSAHLPPSACFTLPNTVWSTSAPATLRAQGTSQGAGLSRSTTFWCCTECTQLAALRCHDAARPRASAAPQEPGLHHARRWGAGRAAAGRSVYAGAAGPRPASPKGQASLEQEELVVVGRVKHQVGHRPRLLQLATNCGTSRHATLG